MNMHPIPTKFSRQTRRSKGFTLIELLVVLAIGSLLVALVPPAFDRLRDVSQYHDTVRAIVVDLKQARQQALAYGQVLSLIHISEPTRQAEISYAVFCLKKKK